MPIPFAFGPIPVWPYSCLLISDRKYFIIVSIYVAEVVV